MSRKKKRKKTKAPKPKKKRTTRRPLLNEASEHSVHDINEALHFHQTGQLDRARFIYEEILKAQPNDADALHFLGVLFQQRGETHKALDLIKKAIQNDPENPFYHNNLGIALAEQNKTGEAVSCYQQALALKPDYAEAFNNLGISDNFVTHGTRSELLREVGLDPEGIAAAIKEMIYREHKTAAGLLHKLVLRKNGGQKKKNGTRQIKQTIEDS